MLCLCTEQKFRTETVFYWPNFTFARSRDTVTHHHHHHRTHSFRSSSNRRNRSSDEKSVSHLPRRHRRKSLPLSRTMSNNEYQPPAGPPPSYSSRLPGNGRHVTFQSPGTSSENHAAPPMHQNSLNPFRRAHTAQQDPPPSRPAVSDNEGFLPPPGPPPSHKPASSSTSGDNFAPPPGPPPSHANAEQEPPPYDPWMQVPDNSILPPPPSLGYDESPTANASSDQAERARAWCRSNNLYPPRQLSHSELSDQQTGAISLSGHPALTGTISARRAGNSLVRTRPNTEDNILLTNIPLFAAHHDHPRVTGRPKTIYYEIRVLRMGGDPNSYSASEADAGIAIGFAAPPYPSWRLPGWERASLGVHGDDGRRYVDNNRGGQDFTSFFQKDDVVGIGMIFRPPQYSQRLEVEVFFTRNGRKEGGWDLFEERDADDEGGVGGLDGTRDLLGAIGFFGGVEFETRFRRDEWLFRP